ncbi:hypothetical protein DERF_009063 [Dermatophagoides farinae]|uniref:GAG-pre-integrase domain-containing protein n=1 Tax=Dermatophagoides farinae TaxID=6954 RepID=A0A922HU85_DERFA|nr:hypothetical protein DERF_009063 [Dermatophagoides farinae]
MFHSSYPIQPNLSSSSSSILSSAATTTTTTATATGINHPLQFSSSTTCSTLSTSTISTISSINNNGHQSLLYNKQVEFELASDETVTSKKIGNIIIQPKPDCKLLLKDVAYGGFSSNLISVRKLTEDGFKIIFEDNIAYISKNDISFTAKTDENNLWIINSQPKNIVLNLWHKRLAHCGQNQIRSKILHPKPIIAHVGNKFKHNSIAIQSESLTKSMDELAISNCLNTEWMARINRSLSSPMISIDFSTIMVNLISKCKNQMVPSIKAILNYDFNANYILKSFLDNLKNNFNYGDIKFNDGAFHKSTCNISNCFTLL